LNSTASVSSANLAFDIGIRDAEELLKHFDNAYELPRPPENAEVLKRAGLIMACTAWETYVEDRISEELRRRLATQGDRRYSLHCSKVERRTGSPAPHLVTRDELREAISFLKSLVEATEKALFVVPVVTSLSAALNCAIDCVLGQCVRSRLA
jgi:hypothetical protein